MLQNIKQTQPINLLSLLSIFCSSYISLSLLLISMCSRILNRSALNFFSDIILMFFFTRTGATLVRADFFTAVTGTAVKDDDEDIAFRAGSCFLTSLLLLLVGLRVFLTYFVDVCLRLMFFFLFFLSSGFNERHFHSTDSFRNHSKLRLNPSCTMRLSTKQGYSMAEFLNSIL